MDWESPTPMAEMRTNTVRSILKHSNLSGNGRFTGYVCPNCATAWIQDKYECSCKANERQVICPECGHERIHTGVGIRWAEIGGPTGYINFVLDGPDNTIEETDE